MTSVRRILTSAVLALFTLIFVAATTLFFLGHRSTTWASYDRPTRHHFAAGYFSDALVLCVGEPGPWQNNGWVVWSTEPSNAYTYVQPTSWSFLGFHFARYGTRTRAAFLALPYWFLIALSVPVAAVGARRWWRRRKRTAPGHCLGCGYDLRATRDRCPECGAVPKRPAPP